MAQNLDYPSGFIGIGVNDSSLSSTKSEDTRKRAPIILVLDKNIHVIYLNVEIKIVKAICNKAKF